MDWKHELEVGDKVIVSQYHTPQVKVVTRLTKTQIVVGRQKYNKTYGSLIGGSTWNSSYISEWTQEAEDKINRRNMCQSIKQLVDKGRLKELEPEVLKEVFSLIGGEMVSTES